MTRQSRGICKLSCDSRVALVFIFNIIFCTRGSSRDKDPHRPQTHLSFLSFFGGGIKNSILVKQRFYAATNRELSFCIQQRVLQATG